MILVIDANILFAALIKDSVTAALLFADEIQLVTPEFVLEEFSSYKKVLLAKTKRTETQFKEIVLLLKEIIAIVPQEEYEVYLEKAERFSPDPKDVAYLALALKLKCGIWSNDKKLKEQEKVRIYSTSEIMKMM